MMHLEESIINRKNKIVCLVPARSGSKGFKNKNISILNGKTLIEHAVLTSLKCSLIDETYISTDSKKYENIALKAGAKSFGLRNKNLSSDHSKTVDVVINFLNNFKSKPDILLILQPTSPIRTHLDIYNSINLLRENNYDSVVSVCKHDEPHPMKLKVIKKNGIIKSYIPDGDSELPRQKLDKVFCLNGCIYLIKTEIIYNQLTLLPNKTFGYQMDKCFNIDSELDYLFLKYLFSINYFKNDKKKL